MRLTLQNLKVKGLELRLASGVCEALSRRVWRGHVRELQAVLERCAIFSRGEVVGMEKLFDDEPVVSEEGEVSEEAHLRALIRDWKGSRADLAAHLGVSERTIYRWIERCRREK